MSSTTTQPAPQTPQDASTSSAPFVIHVDAPAYTANNSSAPQRIPVDSVSKKFDDANAVENVDDGAWETDICGCCYACGSAFYTWLLPCMVVNDVFVRIGRSGVLGFAMFAVYAGMAVLAIFYQLGGKTEVIIEYKPRYYGSDRVTYYVLHDKQAGLMLGAIACALTFCVVVGKVRNAVRQFYHIPGSWGRDLALAFFCTCCALAQANIHTERAEKKKNAELAATLPAYTEA